MLLNNGFTFTNIISDKYTIENEFPEFNNNLGDDSLPIIVGSSSYITSEIKTTLNEYGESISLDLISININSEKEILDFCSKYGFSINTGDIDCDNSNDYIFRSASKLEQLAFSIAANGQYTLSLNSMKSFIKYIRQIFILKDAIDNKKFSTIIESVIYFALTIDMELTDPEEDEGPTLLSNSPDLFVFNYNYYNYLSTIKFYYYDDEEIVNKTFSEKILFFLSQPFQDKKNNEYCRMFYYSGVDHLFFHAMSLLLKRTIKENDIINVDMLNGVEFASPLTEEHVCTIVKDFEEELLNLGRSVLIDIINANLSTTVPTLSYKDGKIVQDLKISSLDEAIYVDIFFRLGEFSKTKKCENPTCDGFFYARDTNKNKIYCSKTCAQLMAKRMQRQREKEKAKQKT